MKTSIKQKITKLRTLAQKNIHTSTKISCSEVSTAHVFKYIKTEHDANIFRKELSLALGKLEK